MFKIPKEQSDSIREQTVAGSRRKIMAALCESLPDVAGTMPETQLKGVVDRGIDKADDYGMGSEHGTYCYCAASLLYGESFDQDPNLGWNREILDDETMDDDVKSSLIGLRIKMDHGREI